METEHSKAIFAVPSNLLERLLEVKRFNCPHCKEGQQINPDIVTKYSNQPRIEPALVSTNPAWIIDGIFLQIFLQRLYFYWAEKELTF